MQVVAIHHDLLQAGGHCNMHDATRTGMALLHATTTTVPAQHLFNLGFGKLSAGLQQLGLSRASVNRGTILTL
jgi:hypothetical protein